MCPATIKSPIYVSRTIWWVMAIATGQPQCLANLDTFGAADDESNPICMRNWYKSIQWHVHPHLQQGNYLYTQYPNQKPAISVWQCGRVNSIAVKWMENGSWNLGNMNLGSGWM